MNRIQRFLIFSLCLFPMWASAQDLEQTWQQAQNAFQELDNYHGRVITKIYGTEASNQPIQVNQMDIRKKERKRKKKQNQILPVIDRSFLCRHEKRVKVKRVQILNLH